MQAKSLAPTRRNAVGNVKLIQYPRDNKIYQIGYILHPVVKARIGRQDYNTEA